MKINLYGYYGAGEFCDDYLEMAIRKTFDDIGDKTGDKIEWNTSHPDAIILGGGSILGIEYDFSILRSSNIPFYIYGSGFRDIDNQKLLLLKYLFDRASFVALRGNASINRLRALGLDISVETLGDPIFLCKHKTDVETSNNKNKESFIGGVFRPYITQDSVIKKIFEFLRETRNEDVKLFTFAKDQGDHIGGQMLGYNTVSLDIFQTYREIRKAHFWFGNRLHPFCISLINGIPTIGLDIEFKKVEDVCSTIGYPYWIKNENLSLDIFKDMYYNLMKDKNIYKTVQTKIDLIRNNLDILAKKIIDDIRDKT